MNQWMELANKVLDGGYLTTAGQEDSEDHRMLLDFRV